MSAASCVSGSYPAAQRKTNGICRLLVLPAGTFGSINSEDCLIFVSVRVKLIHFCIHTQRIRGLQLSGHILLTLRSCTVEYTFLSPHFYNRPELATENRSSRSQPHAFVETLISVWTGPSLLQLESSCLLLISSGTRPNSNSPN